MKAPRKIVSTNQVKLIFAGGFLGSGKTTALAALAKRLIRRGMRVGIITNDQTENLVDTVIVRQMLGALGVAVEEVVTGCFCCKFDELIDKMEKILAHKPEILMGEPVGSCTDFVAAVANPIKIYYRDIFHFAPFSTMVDPDRVRELFLNAKQSTLPEDVAYLFEKQLEEADIIVLNKIDLLSRQETTEILSVLGKRFPEKTVMAISAKDGNGLDDWLGDLLSGRPGANTVLRKIDYDRYANAEAVLGWLNAAISLRAYERFSAPSLAEALILGLQRDFKQSDAEIGHLKLAITSAGKSVWVNVTNLAGMPMVNGEETFYLSKGTLLINARVRLEPEMLEKLVRDRIKKASQSTGIRFDIKDLQCFSPAYPEPPHLMRDAENVSLTPDSDSARSVDAP